MKCEDCRFSIPCWAGQFGSSSGDHSYVPPVQGCIHTTICPECGRLTVSFLDQKDPDRRRVLARVPGGGEYYDRSLTARTKEYGENPGWSRVEELCLPHEFHFTFYCEQRPLTEDMVDLWRRSDKHYDTQHGSVLWCQYSNPDLNMQGPLLIRACYQCGPEPTRPFVEIVELERRP